MLKSFGKSFTVVYVDGEKLSRNGQKTATYFAASFLPIYTTVNDLPKYLNIT